ncbi:MAG: hypothetical protein RSE56_03895 [Bacilli bacterium]
MKKLNIKLFVSLTAVILGLASCSGPSTVPSVDPTTSTDPTTTTTTTTTVIDEVDYKVNKDLPHAATSYTQLGEEKALNMFNIEANAGMPTLNPLGEQRLLIVPVGLNDDTGENPLFPGVSKSGRTDKQTTERLDQIENLFFGKAEETGWQSIKSFYETSSFGKVTVSGSVLKPNGGWYKPNLTPTELVAKGGNAGTDWLLDDITDYYKTEYAKADHGALGTTAQPLTWYDQNKDGFVDTIWMVYSCAIHAAGGQSDFWAFVSRNGGNINRPNIASPVSMNYGWASIDFMDQAYGTGKDAHTFIHETGHIFGLDDYYSYDHNSSPMGALDMMDNNIGDHNAFSKFTLGWNSPLVVTESSRVTLRSGAETGDCFLIASPGYNNTAFDEYLMVEFVTPTKLNQKDYTGVYPGNSLQGFSEPGIRITHVDARVFGNGQSHDEYAKNIKQVAASSSFRVMNTPSGRNSGLKDSFPITKKSMYLLHLIEAVSTEEENCLTQANYRAKNETLFTEGFTYNPAKASFSYFMPSNTNIWNKAKTSETEFDINCKMNFKLKVESVTNDQAVVAVTYTK